MAEFRLSPKAQGDLDQIFDYTVARWGLAQALHYLDHLEDACAILAASPNQAQNCDDISAGYRRRGVERHVIYFREADYGIAVVRILHQRMNAIRHL